MCLYSRENFRIADKNIVVYKIFEHYNAQIMSSFMDKKYTKNHMYKETLFRPAINVVESNMLMWEFGFHSCLTLKSAKSYMKATDICKGHIYKCIIPKGSKYVIGSSSGVDNLVVSNQIIVKRKLLFNIF